MHVPGFEDGFFDAKSMRHAVRDLAKTIIEQVQREREAQRLRAFLNTKPKETCE